MLYPKIIITKHRSSKMATSFSNQSKRKNRLVGLIHITEMVVHLALTTTHSQIALVVIFAIATSSLQS